jgi:hypothetical protein
MIRSKFGVRLAYLRAKGRTTGNLNELLNVTGRWLYAILGSWTKAAMLCIPSTRHILVY